MAVRVNHADQVRRRLERLFLLITLCYAALLARLVYLQAIHGQYYRSTASRMRTRRIGLTAQRGAIVDRDGKPLAITTFSGMLVCDPTLVKDPARTAEAAAALIGVTPGEILPFVSPGRLTAAGTPSRDVVVRRGLEPDAVEALMAARDNRALRGNLVGLNVTEQAGRSNPAGRDTAQLVGFTAVGKDGKPHGLAGLERSLDRYLHGEDGQMHAEVDGRGRVIPETQGARIEPIDGLDARLTIDSTIQHIAETELQAVCARHSPVGATAVVLDPRTGDVLALVSKPDFDPVTRAELRGKEPRALVDRALSLYEPGSIMKPVTAAAAMQEHVITADTPFYCGGTYKVGKRTIHCVAHGGHAGHGAETVRGIVEQSCNVGTAQIGLRLGMARLRKYLAAFGLLSPTGVALPSDQRGRLGFGDEETSGGAGKVSRVAFGQSVMVTPLGMAIAYGAIANGGVLMRPRLVQDLRTQSGDPVREMPVERLRTVVSPEVAAQVAGFLEGVVKNGTGRKVAEVPGYRVAGKTGTAQKVTGGSRGYASGKYMASFVGFLPASSPRAVICVVVDEPQNGYYGAQVAAPVFQAIARQLMWYWKVPPDDPASLRPRSLARH